MRLKRTFVGGAFIPSPIAVGRTALWTQTATRVVRVDLPGPPGAPVPQLSFGVDGLAIGPGPRPRDERDRGHAAAHRPRDRLVRQRPDPGRRRRGPRPDGPARRRVVDTTDPAIAATYASAKIVFATCRPLVGYADRPGAAGTRLVPDAAVAMPRVSADRRTWSFRVRDGMRFSPPSGEPITAASFVRAFERTRDPRMRSYYVLFLGDIRAMRAAGDRVVVELRRPLPDLLARMAQPWACPVPRATPVRAGGVPAIPASGPYYVASEAPGRAIVLQRNPNYDGDRPRALERMYIRVGVQLGVAVPDIASGKLDTVIDGFFLGDDEDDVRRRFPEDNADGPRFVSRPVPSLRFYQLQHAAGRVRRRAHAPRREPRDRPPRARARAEQRGRADRAAPATDDARVPALAAVPARGPGRRRRAARRRSRASQRGDVHVRRRAVPEGREAAQARPRAHRHRPARGGALHAGGARSRGAAAAPALRHDPADVARRLVRSVPGVHLCALSRRRARAARRGRGRRRAAGASRPTRAPAGGAWPC